MPWDCPNGDHTDEHDGVRCSECDYGWRYDDLADFGRDRYRYIVSFECLNCGNRFKRGMPEDSCVRIKPSSVFDQAQVDSVNGNLIVGNLFGKSFQFHCDVCNCGGALYIHKRTPIEPKGSK